MRDTSVNAETQHLTMGRVEYVGGFGLGELHPAVSCLDECVASCCLVGRDEDMVCTARLQQWAPRQDGGIAV